MITNTEYLQLRIRELIYYYILMDEDLRRAFPASYDAADDTTDATDMRLDKQLEEKQDIVFKNMVKHLETTEENLDNYKVSHMLDAIEEVLMDYVEEVLF